MDSQLDPRKNGGLMRIRLIVFGAMFVPLLTSALPVARSPGVEFEVASIKPTRSPFGVMGGCHGRNAHFGPTDMEAEVPVGRCVITAGRLSHIMAIAFRIDVNKIGGRPDWEGPSRFDIEAKAENPAPTQEELLEMLRVLLADRFKLKFSRETKLESGYALVIAKMVPSSSGRFQKKKNVSYSAARALIKGMPLKARP